MENQLSFTDGEIFLEFLQKTEVWRKGRNFRLKDVFAGLPG